MTDELVQTITLAEIVEFLKGLEYESDLKPDMEISTITKWGDTFSAWTQVTALSYALSHFLKGELGRNYSDMHVVMQRYFELSLEVKQKAYHPFPASEMNNIETALKYLVFLETKRHG